MEIVIGAISAAVSLVTGIMSYNAAQDANKARKEANDISSAQSKNESVDSRRKAVREERVRRAMIMQGSVNSGVGTSGSGPQGAMGALGTNLGSVNSTASGQTTAIQGINRKNQDAANYDFESSAWGAFGNIFSNAIGAFSSGAKEGSKASLANS
jgi:hypothetical protein